MSISTKGGDRGTTSLWTGERVQKDDFRVEAYGSLDELESFLSETSFYVKSYEVKNIIQKLKNMIFKINAEIASKGNKTLLTVEDEKSITNLVNYYEKKINLKGFVILGTTLQSSKLDICRTVCRRAERRIVTLSKSESISEILMKYVNRMSDLLFVLARFEEYLQGKIVYR